MYLKWTTSTLIVIIAHLYNNTYTFVFQLIDRISIYKVCISRWVLGLNKSECHALFILLLLLWWLDMRQSCDCWPHTSSGMPEMILKLASSNWPSKGQAKAEDKYHILATTKKLKLNFGVSLTSSCLHCLRSVYFFYNFEQIFLLKSYIKKTAYLLVYWRKTMDKIIGLKL